MKPTASVIQCTTSSFNNSLAVQRFTFGLDPACPLRLRIVYAYKGTVRESFTPSEAHQATETVEMQTRNEQQTNVPLIGFVKLVPFILQTKNQTRNKQRTKSY